MSAALTLGSLPIEAQAHSRATGERSLSFYNLHTGENLTSTYWAEGNYVASSLAEIDLLLRDFRTGDVQSIDRLLLDLLHALRDRMGSGETYHVISGYRSPKTNRMLAQNGGGVAKKSLHMQGRAIDLRLPGRALDELRRAAIELGLGGVGYYPKPAFVHLDVGRVRYW